VQNKLFASCFEVWKNHDVVHGGIGSVARPAASSREGGVRHPVGAQLFTFLYAEGLFPTFILI
jgi:hypothetical protein